MNIPESSELHDHRMIEKKRDNELMIWLFVPGYTVGIFLIVAIATGWNPTQFVPYMIGTLLFCILAGAWRRRGIKGALAMFAISAVSFALVIPVSKLMGWFISLL